MRVEMEEGLERRRRRRRRTLPSSNRDDVMLDRNLDPTTPTDISVATQRWWWTGSSVRPQAIAMDHTVDTLKRPLAIRRTTANPIFVIAMAATVVLPTTIAVPPPRPSRSGDDEGAIPKRHMGRTQIPPRDRRRSSNTNRPYSPNFTTLTTPTITTIPSHISTPTRISTPPQKRNDVAASDPTTTSLPPACSSILEVEETALPYYLTQDPDGIWQKQDGWILFGRGIQTASSSSNTAATTTTTAASAISTAIATALSASPSNAIDITQSLPKGWGSTSNRSSLYAVPLIVVSSVILALLITAFVSFIVISRVNRKKKLGRRKRREEGEQRAKLRTGGLVPPEANTARSSIEGDGGSVFSEKSGRGRRQLRGVGLGGKRIHEWRKGLRRRKKAGKEDKVVEDLELDGTAALDVAVGSSETRTEVVAEEETGSSATTTITVEESEESSTSMASGHAQSPPHATGAVATTFPIDNITPSPMSPVLNLTRNEIEQVEADAEEQATAPSTITGGIIGFLPAYRPASIYTTPASNSQGYPSDFREEPSLVPYEAGGTPSDGAHIEKAVTTGYYPAPTTIEQEDAVAVASGSRPLEAEDPATSLPAFGHVATDDKRLLEQLMRNAGSMPGSAEETISSSAPVVDVDEDGFERLEGGEDGPSAPPPTSSVVGLPAPPKPVSQVSSSVIHLLNDAEMSKITSVDLQHQETSQPDFRAVQVETPSAPAFDEDEEGESV